MKCVRELTLWVYSNLRQNTEPPKNKPVKQSSPMELEERARLAAEIKK
jgi:hypothetical protein